MSGKKKKIPVAIVGVGNCASALVQGIQYCAGADPHPDNPPGHLNIEFCGYKVDDIEIVAAFDVNKNKIGRRLSEAIFAAPNNCNSFCEPVHNHTIVLPGYIGDGVAPHLEGIFPLQEDPTSVVQQLRTSGAEICISFLPTGSHDAAYFYANACVDAHIAFINGMPTPIASDPEWSSKFKLAGIPCAGDDVQSQIGATILHRSLFDLIIHRGCTIDASYQLDIGGNMDFNNLNSEKRYHSKKQSKTDALTQYVNNKNVEVAPVGYIPFLKDNKVAHIRIDGRQFGGEKFSIEAKLSVQDSPNSAGIIIDAIRAMKKSINAGMSGYQEWSTCFFKHPMKYISLNESNKLIKEFSSAKGTRVMPS